jgi:hypothetical protein
VLFDLDLDIFGGAPFSQPVVVQDELQDVGNSCSFRSALAAIHSFGKLHLQRGLSLLLVSGFG